MLMSMTLMVSNNANRRAKDLQGVRYDMQRINLLKPSGFFTYHQV